ncbi:MAG: hypothetical protein WDA26_07460 [Pusillimonas sp.]
MNEFALATSVGLIFLFFTEFINSYIVYKKRRNYQKEGVREKCRREFAILRTDFFELARTNKLNINSVLTQFVFIHLTSLVRNPDHFKEYIEGFITSIKRKKEVSGNKEMVEELKQWPIEAHEILHKTIMIIEKELLPVFSPFWFRALLVIFTFLKPFTWANKSLIYLEQKQRKESNITQYEELNCFNYHKDCLTN